MTDINDEIYISLHPKNTDWKERKSKKGDIIFYRKYNDKFINVGMFKKSNHVWVSYGGVFVKDHNVKFTNNEQLKKDVDGILDLIVNIAN